MVPGMSKLMHIGILLVAIAASGCKKKTEPEGSAAATTGGEAKTAPAPAQPADSIVGQEITYNAGGTILKGYIAYDKAIEGKRPGVLVVHEWWGHNDYARERARQLAKMGYTALAVDMYGDGKQAAHPDDAKKFAMEVMGNMDEEKSRFEAGMKALEKQPTTDPAKIAAIGYCFGGGVVLEMARAGLDLRGVASFHGMLGTEHPAQKGAVKAKILVLQGEADPFVPHEQVEAFKKEMAAAEAPVEYHGYPGAKHAFTNPGATDLGKKFELPLAYDEEADKASWAELDGFLKRIFAD